MDLAVGFAVAVHADVGGDIAEVPGQGGRAQPHLLARPVAGPGQACRVGREVMGVAVLEQQRVFHGGAIQRRAQGLQPVCRLVAIGEVPVFHDQPLPGRDRQAVQAGGCESRQLRQVQGCVIQVAAVDPDGLHRVHMGVVQSGQYPLALQVGHGGSGADPGAGGFAVTHEQDAIAADRQRAGRAPIGVRGIDRAVRDTRSATGVATGSDLS